MKVIVIYDGRLMEINKYLSRAVISYPLIVHLIFFHEYKNVAIISTFIP